MKSLLNVLSLTLFLVTFPMLAHSETIDVFIKGVDDGVKTNKQQDYKEAVMNAKLEAIERAGVEIASVTKVVNFKTKYDMVESKAKAALLPGFQIMDMGYQPDGTYAVVLSGKVRAGKDAEDGAKRRKQAIQQEIVNVEIRLATVERTIYKVKKSYDSWKEDFDERTYKTSKKCSTVECFDSLRSMHDSMVREETDNLNRTLAGLPEERNQLKLRLSQLRMELANYPSDTDTEERTALIKLGNESRMGIAFQEVERGFIVVKVSDGPGKEAGVKLNDIWISVDGQTLLIHQQIGNIRNDVFSGKRPHATFSVNRGSENVLYRLVK